MRFLKLPKRLKKPLILRRVAGHSMLPVLPPGTLVVGTSLLAFPKLRSVVVVEHEGKEKIKRIAEVKDNQILLVGDHDITGHEHDLGWTKVSEIVARVVWPLH